MPIWVIHNGYPTVPTSAYQSYYFKSTTEVTLKYSFLVIITIKQYNLTFKLIFLLNRPIITTIFE